MKLYGPLILFLLLPALSPGSHPLIVLSGKVTRIIDGDTFDLLTASKTTVRVRMRGIDCPERKQDFYQAAKNALALYIFQKEVKIVSSHRDRNRRLIATVFSGGRNINLAMVKEGYAWHYRKYSNDRDLAAAESQARAAAKGLWSGKNVIAPWRFREQLR